MILKTSRSQSIHINGANICIALTILIVSYAVSPQGSIDC